MKLFCCKCGQDSQVQLTTGEETYPHRKDLYHKPFWQCIYCSNFVGCHPNTTKPLGVIPTKTIKEYRKKIHSLLDPLWQSKKYTRKEVYHQLSIVLGREYHTADLRTIEECKNIERTLRTL